jgi:hypothetical protein
MYDALADGWQKVLQNIDKALEATGAGRARRAERQERGPVAVLGARSSGSSTSS